jgi:rubrerythrin
MSGSNVLEILKNAYVMEQRGKTLYETAADHADDSDVQDFFRTLAEEETVHMKILEHQMKAVHHSGRFEVQNYGTEEKGSPGLEILDDTLVQKINAAGFEATAVTAAVGFEEKAVRVYAQRAKEAADPEEKRVYDWLSSWENLHLKKLTALQEALTEKAWGDNSFWPF